jgi:arylsulfatase A-like enzyme
MNSKYLKVISYSISLVGALAIIFSFAADSLGVGGEPGFGLRQAGLFLLGLIVFISGLILAIPRSRDYILHWRADRFIVENPPPVLLIATWFGLFAGLAEDLILLYQLSIMGKVIPYGINVIWMAPLAYVIAFIALGLLLLLLSRKIPRYISSQVIVFIFAFLAYFGTFLWLHQIQRIALVVLALGLAVQTARMAAAHPNAFYFLLYHTLGWTRVFNLIRVRRETGEDQPAPTNAMSRREFLISSGLLIGGLAFSVTGLDDYRDYSRISKIPKIGKKLPNVILITLDTVRAKSLSLYGNKRRTTPQLERLAQRGVVFERAFSTAPWTLTSHAGIFTGHYPHDLSADWRTPLDDTYPTLAEFLSAQGYITAGFIANVYYCSTQWGLSRGFAHYEDYPISAGEMIRSAKLTDYLTDSDAFRHTFNYYNTFGRKTAEHLNRDFLNWHSKNQKEPFFAFLNYFDAHNPYLPPDRFLKLFGPELHRDNPIRALADWTGNEKQQIQAELNAYEGVIAYIDHQLGLLFDELEKRGIFDDTVVVITSDHGEHFGENGGLMEHGQSLYMPEVHVPLIVLYPAAVPVGMRINQNVTIRDLAITILDLIGLKDKNVFPGSSISPYWTNTQSVGNLSESALLVEVNRPPFVPQKQAPVNKGDLKALIMDRYHYIKNGDGSEELYDFEADPQESIDLVNLPENQKRLDQFRLTLDSYLQNQPVEE